MKESTYKLLYALGCGVWLGALIYATIFAMFLLGQGGQ